MADDRKSRLAALAAKAGRNIPPSTANTDNNAESNDSKPKLAFRNYVPKDAALSAPPDVDDDGEGGDQPTSKRQKTTTSEPKSALEQALSKATHISHESSGHTTAATAGVGWSNITNVETKKVNWDLKRDIQSKMERLERRTQKAIVELLRERLEREAAEGVGGGDDDSDLD
jgi:coiled-coil domain-containing protein 12